MARYADVPEELERHLASRTPEWASAVTGLGIAWLPYSVDCAPRRISMRSISMPGMASGRSLRTSACPGVRVGSVSRG